MVVEHVLGIHCDPVSHRQLIHGEVITEGSAMSVVGISSELPEIATNGVAFLISVQSAKWLIDVGQVVGIKVELDTSGNVVLQ